GLSRWARAVPVSSLSFVGFVFGPRGAMQGLLFRSAGPTPGRNHGRVKLWLPAPVPGVAFQSLTLPPGACDARLTDPAALICNMTQEIPQRIPGPFTSAFQFRW